MKAAEAKAAANAGSGNVGDSLSVNQAVLDSEKAQSVLGDLEKKYDIKRNDFTQKLLEAKGDPELLGNQDFLDDLLNGKVKREDVDKALATADGLTEKEKAALIADSRVAGLGDGFLYNLNKKGATSGSMAKVATSSLREKLKRKLASAGGGEAAFLGPQAVPAVWGKQLVNNKSDLTPIADPLFTNAAEVSASEDERPEAELTLFDVVHRKYSEKCESMRGQPAGKAR